MTSANHVSDKSRAWIEIDLGAVRKNVESVHASLSALKNPCGLMAVVKCNAYGHGLVPVARTALEAGASWLGVAAVSEASALRAADITAPIFLTCVPTPQDCEQIIRLQITALLGDGVMLNALIKAQESGKRCSVHLDIDTGMGRSGVLPDQAVELWRKALAAGIDVSGVTTHFADSEHPESDIHLRQESLFKSTLEKLHTAGAKFEWIHTSNSAAALTEHDYPTNLVRPGLLIYGISPFSAQNASAHPILNTLQPALSLKAKVAQIRELPVGHTISYGATYTLTRPSRAATVLIGYGDGYPRRLSNCGYMLIRGKRAPILGRVCMDQTVVDVTDIPTAEPGDAAICIGQDCSEQITIEGIAAQIGTTAHEIPVSLTERLPRVYVNLG